MVEFCEDAKRDLRLFEEEEGIFAKDGQVMR